MSICGKYTIEERKIARKIADLKHLQREAYKRWHDYDVRINILINQLGGKYKSKKR